MLNESQQKAYHQIRQFLLNPSTKYMALQGPAGFGKSYLLNHIENEWSVLNNQRKFLQMDTLTDIRFGCSTNKAAAILNDSQTIHKLFGLIPRKDFKTGKTYTVTTARTQDVGKSLIVLDEASMLNESILKIVDNYTSEAKVLFVGDQYQLAPIGSSTSPAFSKGYPSAELTVPMRQDKDSHLFKEVLKLRDAVIKGEHYLIQEGEGVTVLGASEFKQRMLQSFSLQEDARVLAYTNKQVEGYNKYIQKSLHGSSDFAVGDVVIANNRCLDSSQIEQSYRISQINGNHVTLNDGVTYPIPMNKSAWFQEIKAAERAASKSGQWEEYFHLKEGFLDIRYGFSCTVDKSQGSTYEKVFIDLQNLYSCRNLNTLLRLLYVAVSRARTEVFLYKG